MHIDGVGVVPECYAVQAWRAVPRSVCRLRTLAATFGRGSGVDKIFTRPGEETTTESQGALPAGPAGLFHHPWSKPLGLFIVTTGIGLAYLPLLVLRGSGTSAIIVSMIGWWQWIPIALLISWFDRTLPFTEKQSGRRLAAHAALGMVVTVSSVLINGQIGYELGVNTWLPLAKPLQGFDWLLWCCLVYSLVLGGVFAVAYYERYRLSEMRNSRLEFAFVEARLNALRMQLDPHFLFNTLNAISSHVERDPKLARTMIEHLGDLLRLSLETKDRQEVALFEELNFLDHYLEIQRIRFGDRLKVEINVAPDVKLASVPSLFIQPLVENAIRHGLSRRAAGGKVIISAEKSGDQVDIRVCDDGVGLPQGWQLETSAGHGLSITRERIAGYYAGSDCKFAVQPRPEGGTEVRILLPYRKLGEPKDGSNS